MTTRSEQGHLDAVASLGCIVCRNEGNGYVPALVHHLRRNPETGAHLGMSQRAEHAWTIPLCPAHHQYGGFGVAYHAGPREFEKNYGTEVELWNQVEEMLKRVA